MYSVSQKYVEAMKRPVQRHRIKGTVNGVAFTEDNILSGSFTITGRCSDTSNVQIGQVYTSELKITLLDSLKKRLNFLDTVINSLGLEGVTTVHARAEDAGRKGQYREKFDIAVARAVAPMNVLLEYCLPLVKKDGFFIALKGSRYKEEITEAEEAVRILGGNLTSVKEFELPGLNDERAVIVIRKIKDTPPAYPRKAGLPAKKPLGGN